MRWQARRERLRAVLEGGRCVHPASVHDPISARIAADLGFEVGMFAGSVASMAVLGAPDLIVLTLSELAEQAARMNRAADLPVFVDADHGYGNALNVMRTVEEMEAAGISGLSIEDTELPRPHGSGGAARLTSLEEGIGKMRAALAARPDPALVVAGRTSAIRITGLEDTLRRARAYADVGVDAIFLVGVRTREELDAVHAEIRLPLIMGGLPQDIAGDTDYLSSRGVRICLQPHAPIRAVVQAIHDTMSALRDGTAPSALERLASPELMQRVTLDDDYRRWSEDFLD
jgi:carboxyvinyl-carboxyphosphonate phosphorylmutase